MSNLNKNSSAKADRIIYLKELNIDFQSHSAKPLTHLSKAVYIQSEQPLYVTNIAPEYNSVYNHFPILLEVDGATWYEGNLFLYSLVSNESFNYSTQAISRKASILLDYKIWCENEVIDMFDFSSVRPKHRPTYRYFAYLRSTNISAQNINQRTSLIFKFTCFFAKKYNIDINRVDKTSDSIFIYKTSTGGVIRRNYLKRSQTLPYSRSTSTSINKVLDDGELLRPLNNKEQEQLITALESKRFLPDERLIFQLALDTGARKQSILTIRLGDIKQLISNNLSKDGSYSVNAGPGTNIDTKLNRPIVIKIPEDTVERLKLYASSKVAKLRRNKFKLTNGNLFKDDDIYLFLTREGNCRYMAKNDPRYKITRNPPTGSSINNIIDKLFSHALPQGFPKDYKFHWNRASFAFNYYQFLTPLVETKQISYRDMLQIIQVSLGHSSQDTTENYLKIFTNPEVLNSIQSDWEEKFFSPSTSKKHKDVINK